MVRGLPAFYMLFLVTRKKKGHLLDIYCSSQKNLSLHSQAMSQDCPQCKEGTDTAWNWRVNRHVKDASPGGVWQDRGWVRGWQST